MTAELAELANRHWLAAYRSLIADLGGRSRQYGAVHAFLGGLPLPFANGCLVLEPAKPNDLRRAVSWLTRAGVPFRVRIDEARGQRAMDECVALGLERASDRLPGMVMKPVREAPALPAGITVERVDGDSHSEFIALLIATGFPAQWAAAAFPPRLVKDRNTAMFIGRLDGMPAASALALRTGDLAGVYAVGTVEEARRRGLGTAVTWACVGAAREWGSEAVVLQASEMGLPIYRAMGFKEVVEYARFGPPEAIAASDGTAVAPPTAAAQS